MTDLAHHQAAMLRLLRGGTLEDAQSDRYLQEVASSRHLVEARRVVLLWRLQVLEDRCALSIALLRSRGALGATLREFVDGQNLSPFLEDQASKFLEWLTASGDPLQQAVAGFEKALAAMREGEESVRVVAWPVDPYPVLLALARGEQVMEPLAQVKWLARVHCTLQGGFALQPVDESVFLVGG